MPRTIQFFAKGLFTETLEGRVRGVEEEKIPSAPSDFILPSVYRRRLFNLSLKDGSHGVLHLWMTAIGDTPKIALMHYQGPVPEYDNPRTHTPNVNLLAVGYPLNQWEGSMMGWLHNSSPMPNNTPDKPLWRVDHHASLKLGRYEAFAPDALYPIIKESSHRLVTEHIERFRGH
jgi:hypothetical protein